MRIAVIAPPWLPVPPVAYGGTEGVVDRLCRGLQTAGHEVTLVTTGDSTCPVPKLWTYEVSQRRRMGNIPVEIRHVLFAYEAVAGYDIIHDHSLIGPTYASAKGFGHVVTTNHGPFDEDAIEAYRRIGPAVGIIAISNHQASTAVGVPIASVIHHGLDLDRFTVGPGGGGYLVFLGRMSPTKGAHRAIRIAKAAGIPIVLAGKVNEPEEHHYFDELIAPELGPHVSYVGEANEPEKIELLGNALALINPIRWPEPFGLVMIEALACGAPVLGFPEGAAPEIVDDGITGFLSESEDAMIAAVSRLESLDRGACRKAAEERFSTERMVAEHLELYERIANT